MCKDAGRSASEPIGSLVTYLEMPTLWSEGEGRRRWDQTTEASHPISRGSRDGMYRQKNSAEREARWGGHSGWPTEAYKV